MVIRLRTPAFDDCDIIDGVILERQNGKNKNYFNGIKIKWKQRVKDYIAAGGNPEIIKPWPEISTEQIKTSYQTLYKSADVDSFQAPILNKLRERTLQFCPACGEDGTPNTLDHYLPKNVFPEFSITSVNLFPMCDTCQGWKLEHTVDGQGARIFLHPYFDVFLDLQIVKVDIGGPYDAPISMTLRANEDLEASTQALVARHLLKLELEKRFYHFFRSEYIHLLSSVRDIRDAQLNLRQQLGLFCSKSKRKSINSWGHVFYEAVLRNEGLLKYLEQGDLPIL